MLEYDNSAFYYFAITLLVIYLIPSTWYVLKEVFRATVGNGIENTVRTKEEGEKVSRIKKETTGLTRLSNTTFLTTLTTVLIAWSIFLYLVSLVSSDGEVNRFDPYTILGIEQGVTNSEIKKAYRKLSLKFHPDKNIGDKIAEEMFMKIAKAYEALTDETSKENYEKYGNPDGKQSLEVSIGLPSILLENPKVVLVLYLIAMVVVIPSVVGYWYNQSKQYGEKNIMYETYNAFYTLLREQHRTKNIPEVLAASAECRKIIGESMKDKKRSNATKEADQKKMGEIYAKMKTDKLMVKPTIDAPLVLNANLLLHAHLMRMEKSLTPTLQKDLSKLLGRCSELVEGVIEISYQRRWLDTSIAAIKFSQYLIQGLWTTNHSLEQLPHFTEEQIKAITKGPKPQAKDLREYLLIPDADKKGLEKMTAEEKKDVLKVASILPNLTVETKLYVEDDEDENFGDSDEEEEKVVEKEEDKEEKEGEEPKQKIKGDDICEQDLVTLKITLTRENVLPSTKKKASTAPYVYAPHFPKVIQENWWLVLTDKAPVDGKKQEDVHIYAFEKVSDQGRTFTHEVRFMAPPKVGNYEMQLMVLSDCYIGLDQTIPINFAVHSASLLPEYQPHQEDLELDNEPTLFEQVMSSNVDDSSDDEDDDEQGEEASPSPKSNGAATKGGVVVTDAESDDSDEED